MFKVFWWNGLEILIPKHMCKSIIGPLEQIQAKNKFYALTQDIWNLAWKANSTLDVFVPTLREQIDKVVYCNPATAISCECENNVHWSFQVEKQLIIIQLWDQ